MIRVAPLLLLVSACGVVDEVGRTSFRLRELPFQVGSEAGTVLPRDHLREQPVDISTNSAVGGASSLDDVRVEDVDIAVYTNSIGVDIAQVQLIVAPVSLEPRLVFAEVSDVDANLTEWPELETHVEGIDQIETFIADQHAKFVVQAAITFDVPNGYVADSAGLLDLRLRISASALAAR